MTNLRRLATVIYDTGDSDRILRALGSLLEVSLKQSDDVLKESLLLVSQVGINAESNE